MIVEDGVRVEPDGRGPADQRALTALRARRPVHQARACRDEGARRVLQRTGHQRLVVAADRFERRIGNDGVAGEPVRVVQIHEAAPRRRLDGVYGASLVVGAVGQRDVERVGVAGREQRPQSARRAAAGALTFHGDDAVDDGEPGTQREVQVEQHVGEIVALLRAHVQLGLGEARYAAEGELDAAGEAHELVRLEDADLDHGVGAHEGASYGEAAEQAPLRRIDDDLVVFDIDDLHALGRAHIGDAADLEGARHLGGAVEPPGAVGDERLGPGCLERAQHRAKGLGMRAHRLLRRGAAQQVDLDGDGLAR